MKNMSKSIIPILVAIMIVVVPAEAFAVNNNDNLKTAISLNTPALSSLLLKSINNYNNTVSSISLKSSKTDNTIENNNVMV